MSGNQKPARRDAAATQRRILDAALSEFATQGHGGARVDRIAEAAGVSKPMIYSYFGDKEELYKAALKESYVQIRQGERAIDTDHMSPEDAIRELVTFTMHHFISKPWFTSMLNTENLRKGVTVQEIDDLNDIQSPLISQLGEILDRGVAEGRFRPGVDPTELYITIASLCFFPVSNKYTLRVVFNVPIDDAWLKRRAEDAGRMVLCFLRPEPDAGSG
ncbi:TetR family transcriptional regulator [Aliiruegeria haliotis]|uniref:TetR family transcriptional regulator n=1 Tax=Aliiruegeria haliotis TaxID=1280846 RepID=A0A2T0RL36_9RHOB|nr:TetR/AcrR family transcriptional regulator [Aliiruegeria haliotis]PRY21847.1 TetR family transcriptional regulator [Aliiruegeria haliotis]